MTTTTTPRLRQVHRVQTGLRIEKRILSVLKGLAAVHELSLGDLIEGIVLHAFEGKSPFRAESLKIIEALKSIHGLNLTAADSHRLTEATARRPASRSKKNRRSKSPTA